MCYLLLYPINYTIKTSDEELLKNSRNNWPKEQALPFTMVYSKLIFRDRCILDIKQSTDHLPCTLSASSARFSSLEI